MALEEFEAVFGEAEAEWAHGGLGANAGAGASEHGPFVYLVRAVDSTLVQVLASDFHLAWERVLTVRLLEDMVDDTGIGGSWSEFFYHLIESLSSGDVKIVLHGLANTRADSGVLDATLVAPKFKGLPSISISLNRLVYSSADNAIADLSMAIFKAFKNSRNNTVKEQKRSFRLTRMLFLEKEGNESLQKQLDAVQERNDSLQKQLDAYAPLGKRKVSRLEASDRASPISDTLSYSSMTLSDMSSAKNPVSMEVSQEALPMHSRLTTRGVFLQNNKDGDEG